jgi:hypothetical protein
MKAVGIAVVLVLVGMTAACGKVSKSSTLSDRLDSALLKAQVALEDAIESPKKVRNAEAELEEQQTLKSAERALAAAQSEAAVVDTEAKAKAEADLKAQGTEDNPPEDAGQIPVQPQVQPPE